jgi:tight adherence protein B
MMGALLLLLFSSGGAFLLGFVAMEVLRKAFEQYRLRYLSRSIRDLGAMFLFIDPRQLLRLNLAAMVVLAGTGVWLGGPVLGAACATAGFFAPAVAVPFYRRRRVRRFDGQLSEALQQMANALRAGLTLQQAIEQVARDAPPPLRQEFGLFIKEVKLGVPLDEALAGMAGRVGSEDLELVATSTVVARQLGGNLAEMFEGIAATIRERFRLEGKIAALTSQGRLQGLIVAALPLVVGLFLNSYRPDLIAPMFQTAYGYALVAAIVLLQSAGFLTIRRIVSVDV